MKSPYANTLKAKLWCQFLENDAEDKARKKMKQELKQAGKSATSATGGGATCWGNNQGDVHALAMLRADHGVDRRMSASTWANPTKNWRRGGNQKLGLH